MGITRDILRLSLGLAVLLQAVVVAAQTLPEGNNGIAARYPNDAGITSDASVLFAGAEAKGHDFIAVLRSLERSRLPLLRNIVLLEGGELDDALHYEELVPRPHEPAPVGLDDCINMQYTSGTTGFPKGVMLSSRNIVNNAWRTGEFLTRHDKIEV